MDFEREEPVEAEEIQSVTVMGDDGKEQELYLVDQARVAGADYLLLTDSQDDGGNAYIYKLTPVPGTEDEMSLEEIPDEEMDYIAGIFAEQSDIDFR